MRNKLNYSYQRNIQANDNYLSNIPKHWNIRRLKHIAKINPSRAEIKKISQDTRVTFCAMEQIGNGFLDASIVKLINEVKQGFTYFRDGDVLIAKITPSFENGKGTIAKNLVNGIGFGTTELHVIRTTSNILNSKFFYYISISHPFREIGAGLMQGTAGQKRVPDSFLLDYLVAIPPLQEQKAIVSFLDELTEKIDALVAKKQMLIELLEEKRQAVINQAVTKGLNPEVPMKNSRIEWLGEIPEHWETVRIKHKGEIALGKMLTNEDKGGYYLRPYLRAKNLKWLNVDIDDVKKMWFSERELDLYKLKEGDLLVSEGGEVGRTCIWINELEECYIQNSVNRIRLKKGSNPRYYLYLFFAFGHAGYFKSIVDRVSIAHLTKERLAEIVVLNPSTVEQNKIVDFLDKFIYEINQLKEVINKEIGLLGELRTSIITSAVIGKIDVREV